MQSRLPPHRARACLRGSCVLLGAWLGGCIETVGLGSECPPGVLLCPSDEAREPQPDLPPQQDLDASSIDRTGDALTGQAEADIDAGGTGEPPSSPDGSIPPPLPALANLSFELTQGQPGDITTISLPSFTGIAPWFTCQPIGGGTTPLTAARAERAIDAASGPIGPTEREAFVSLRYFANLLQVPLIQRLGAPLVAGQPYAFAIDLRATSALAHLSLQVRGADDCLIGSQELLAETPQIRPGEWQRVCVTFTPQRNHAMLMLQVSSNPPLSDDLLLLDNVRAATDCPELR